MMKKQYEKPAMKIYPLKDRPHLLVGSGDPKWWDAPGGPGQY